MLFNSFPFLLFFPAVTLIYFVLRTQKSRIYWLLIASIFFYCYFIPKYLLVLLLLIVIDFLAAIIMSKYADKRTRRIILFVSILSNLSILFLFKYMFLFTGISITNLILPIGLSFHTFQSMSYVFEVYKNKISPEKNFILYTLYVMYFPQLVAGPIEKPQNLIPKLNKLESFSYQNAVSGLKYMVIGMYMKVVIADNLATLIDYIYTNYRLLNNEIILFGVLLFSVQIFCDFAGYSLIAIGTSRFIGIGLSNNFNMPYNATSVTEFWRRWHITLTNWFREYIYIPLGGKRVSRSKFYFNILLVFLLSGLWHGAAWTFILWGLLNGIVIIVESFFKQIKIKIFKPIARLYVFFTASLLWVFFRSENLPDALEIIKKIFSFNKYSFNLSVFKNLFESVGVSLIVLTILFVSMITTILIYNIKDINLYEFIENQHKIVKYIFYLLLTIVIIIYGKNIVTGSPFIYFQF